MKLTEDQKITLLIIAEYLEDRFFPIYSIVREQQP